VARGAGAARQAVARARFTVRGNEGAPARVVLVGADWAPPLSQSRVVKLPRR